MTHSGKSMEEDYNVLELDVIEYYLSLIGLEVCMSTT